VVSTARSRRPSRRLRLLAPVLAVGVVAAGVTLPRLADASGGASSLEPRTAAELLAQVSTAEVDGLSGTVVATSRLGLPELPSGRSGGSAVTLTDLLSGSTTARVWQAGEDRSRVAVDAPFAQTTNLGDGQFAWGAGGGVLVPVHRGARTLVAVDVGGQYRDNGRNARYLRRGGIRDLPGGDVALDVIRSRADVVTWHVGVSVGGRGSR